MLQTCLEFVVPLAEFPNLRPLESDEMVRTCSAQGGSRCLPPVSAHAIVQAKFRQIDEFVYEDRTGATVRQKVPGMFKWEVTPGYWLLQVIWDFFMEPCPELLNEKSNTWYQHLHRTCTFQEGVEFLKHHRLLEHKLVQNDHNDSDANESQP